MDRKTKSLIDTIAYCDGTNTLEDISKKTFIKINNIKKNIKLLRKHNIIKE